MLELKYVSAGYGAGPALRQVSLKVRTGEVVALVGPNGAGKTTVLRTISALLRPTSGEISFNGMMLGGRNPADIVKAGIAHRSEEHTSELQSLMRSSYAVFCLTKKKTTKI